MGEKQEDGKYKHSVDLPKTTFELRANSVQRELELQKLWDDNQVLKRVSEEHWVIFTWAMRSIKSSRIL